MTICPVSYMDSNHCQGIGQLLTMTSPPESPNPADEPEEQRDKRSDEAIRNAGKNSQTVTIHQTDFHRPVTGPIHTGTGDINISHIFSLSGLNSWLDSLFRWSEAPAHMRSSWAGIAIWSLSAVTDRLTPQAWLTFLVVVTLWIVTAWLITPILQWPLDDSQARLMACIKSATASLVVPLLVASITRADNQFRFQIEARRDRGTLWFLKVTGALVGFGVFFAILLFLSLTLYYLTLSTLPVWGWWFLTLLPLTFSHIAARRMPTDRYKMFGSKLQLHDADKLFLGVFLFFGLFIAGFVYFSHGLLANRITGVVFLLVLTGIALWEQKKRTPENLSDLKIIFVIGLTLPLAILLLYLLFSEQIDSGLILASGRRLVALLAFEYMLGLAILWTTLAVRSRPILTLRGMLGLLAVLAILNVTLTIDPVSGRWLTLVIVLLWGVWGRKRFREHLWIHASFPTMLANIGLSFYLVGRTTVPLWANLLGFTMITGILIYWAYSAPQKLLTKTE